MFEARGFFADKVKLFTLLIHKVADKILDPDAELKVNLGSGLVYRKGWKNLDFVSKWYGSRWLRRLVLDYNHDLSKIQPLPFDDNSVDKFYCRMVFEHLEDKMVWNIIDDAYRCLKKDGTFEVMVPNPYIDNSPYLGDSYDASVCGHHINCFPEDEMVVFFVIEDFCFGYYDPEHNGNPNEQYWRFHK